MKRRLCLTLEKHKEHPSFLAVSRVDRRSGQTSGSSVQTQVCVKLFKQGCRAGWDQAGWATLTHHRASGTQSSTTLNTIPFRGANACLFNYCALIFTFTGPHVALWKLVLPPSRAHLSASCSHGACIKKSVLEKSKMKTKKLNVLSNYTNSFDDFLNEQTFVAERRFRCLDLKSNCWHFSAKTLDSFLQTISVLVPKEAANVGRQVGEKNPSKL